MKNGIVQKKIDELFNKFPNFSLKKFEEILREILENLTDLDFLEGKDVLELGPGKNCNFLRFLDEKVKEVKATGMGREPEFLRFNNKKFRNEKIINCFLPDYLKKTPNHSIDLIYSRHFFEKYSINPRILISSKTYWKYVYEARFHDQKEDFPASLRNMEATFEECFRVLKPGGIIVSQIAKKYNSAVTQGFLEKFNFKTIKRRNLTKISEIVTVIK